MSCELDVLRRLERRSRNGRILMLAVVFVAAMVAVEINAQDPKAPVLPPEPRPREAARVVLRDARNLTPDGTPALMFFDAKADLRLSLALSPEGEPGVRLYGPGGRLASSIQTSDRLSPSLRFFGKQHAAQRSAPRRRRRSRVPQPLVLGRARPTTY